MKNTKTKKNSVAKKLIPATSMLLVSATMLATSTYAWFTMSREVEVQNIKLTATVPADMQISLGMLSGITLGQGHGLSDNFGTLAYSGTSADNGGVTAPDGTAEYWSNTADVSAYYAMGKIMPASSTNGLNVYFTPDASGVGKTLKTGAKYYTAVAGASKYYDNGTTTASGTDSRETTLHAFTSTEKPVGGAALSNTDSNLWTKTATNHYTAATGWNDTNDDGYYVDIPIWFRTSCKDVGGIPLSVDAYVTTNAKNDTDDLYLAARAVILKKTTNEKDTTTGLLEIKPDTFNSTTTIVNFMSSTNSTGEAVASLSSGEGTSGVYGTASVPSSVHYTGTADVVTVPAAPANETYGNPVQAWVRVWLEGEDPNCWNENAGQDFSICLKFSRDRLYNSTDVASAPSGTSQNYPDRITALVAADGSTAAANASTLQNGDTVNLTGAAGTLTYVYNTGSGWSRSTESFDVPNLGQQYSATFNSTTATFSTNDELVTLLNTHINTTTLAATSITVSAVDLAEPAAIEATVNSSNSPVYSYSVSALPSPTGKTVTYTLNGESGISATDLPTKLSALPNGTYTVNITYTTT